MSVTWASSQIEAERQIKRADELLERRRWSEALDALAAAQRAIAETREFILREAPP